ncbi:ATP-binding protein [Candidatus Zixiibacteriota bacterium]
MSLKQMESSPKSIFQHTYPIMGGDFTNAGRASSRLRTVLKQIGIPSQVIRRAATAAYEAEMNVVIYARQGELNFAITPEEITIVVEDQGQGIPDIGLAMQEGYSTASKEVQDMGFGAGMGLPNIHRNVDKLEISSVVGRGTTVQFTIRI